MYILSLTLFITIFLLSISQKQECNTKYEIQISIFWNGFLQNFAICYYIMQIRISYNRAYTRMYYLGIQHL